MSLKKIALLGGNVDKSLSPRMQNAAFRQLNLPYAYEAVSVSSQEFAPVFNRLCGEGYQGLNITIPHKEAAVKLMDKLSPTCEKLEAVNTVLFSEKTRGENTDVAGCLESVREKSWGLNSEATVFLVGCGGAAKASVEAFSRLGMRSFAAMSRAESRLRQFRDWFQKQYSFSLQTFLFRELTESLWKQKIRSGDVVVNAAPLEAIDEISIFPRLEFPRGIFLVEWVYLPRTTPWIEKAAAAKGSFIEGYKILLFQGAESFSFWTGREAPIPIMENALLEGFV